MAYIQKKPCKVLECSNMPKMGCGGYCWKHEKLDPAYQDKKDKKSAKKQEVILRVNYGPGSSFIQNNAAQEKQRLENWFRQCAIELDKKPNCQNCNRLIYPKYYRTSTAHILPKRKEYGFPSIATHPMNKLFLGAKFGGCGCHDQYDASWESASKMLIWPVAVQIIVVELYPNIDPVEHKNIPDIIWPHIEKVHGERKLILS
mgnify:CR=1 FL=1